MPSATAINNRIIERITNSGITLTIVYPPARPVATGTSPGVLPISPLTGPAATEIVFPAAPTPYKANNTLKCLWLEAASGRVNTEKALDPYKVLPSGWLAAAEALARVLVSEAAIDPAQPYSGTVIDGADYILFQNKRYTVLQVMPLGASFAPPVSYHIWLVGKS